MMVLTMFCDAISDELQKLCQSGYGAIVTREQIAADKVLPYSRACDVYFKPYWQRVNKSFFDLATDPTLKIDDYIDNFNEDYDDTLKLLCGKYHPHEDMVIWRPPRPVPVKPCMRTALDDLVTQPNVQGNYGCNEDTQRNISLPWQTHDFHTCVYTLVMFHYR